MHQWTESPRVAEDNCLLQQDVQRLAGELRRTRRLLALKDQELHNCLHAFSHEIRSPLTSIRGYASLCHEEFSGRLPAPWTEYLGRIITNADHLGSLINDMVRLSDLSLSEDSFSITSVCDLVDDLISQLRFEHRGKEFVVAVDNDMPTLLTHADSLRQIFNNLLSNAIKYSRPRATLKIRVGYLADELFHKFLVRDNGMGIPADQRQRIFTPFVRLYDKPAIEGSGLGLAIVRRLISIHGGEVWVDSHRGRGSTFYFTLPRTQACAAPAGSSASIMQGETA
jgi:signal transduction histidine kinase